MALRFCIPLIVWILLKHHAILGDIAQRLSEDFTQDYRDAACARERARTLNLRDAFAYLANRYPYVGEFNGNAYARDGELDCRDANILLFRESNPELPEIYPNWLSRPGWGSER